MMTAAPMMTAAVAMTEMFTMMAAVTGQKPAGQAVVRIVGVVTVISAPARKQRGHQQSRQNPSPGNLSPPAPDRFQLGKPPTLI